MGCQIAGKGHTFGDAILFFESPLGRLACGGFCRSPAGFTFLGGSSSAAFIQCIVLAERNDVERGDALGCHPLC